MEFRKCCGGCFGAGYNDKPKIRQEMGSLIAIKMAETSFYVIANNGTANTSRSNDATLSEL